MKDLNSATRLLTSLWKTRDDTFLSGLLGVVRRMVVSVEFFRKNEMTPRSFEQLERRLERLARELARFILEHTLNRVESAKRPQAVTWEHRRFHPNRRSFRSIETLREQRHTRRHDSRGIQRVVRRAAQQRRRHGLKGSEEAYRKAIAYLARYRRFMDYAERRKVGDPIGSGVTEAGCKVIFNQRMKQSGMRWSHRGGQYIVDLRTACRSGIWDRLWRRWQNSQSDLPPMNQTIPKIKFTAA